MITNNAINNNSLTLISTQTVSSVASLEFTSDISGSPINYLILCDNVTSGGTGYALFAQISTDNGATYIFTDYSSVQLGTPPGLSVLVYGKFDATLTSSSQCTLFNVGTPSGLVTSISQSMGWSLISGNAVFSDQCVYTIASTTVNAIQLVMNDGSDFSGTFSLYSYAQ